MTIEKLELFNKQVRNWLRRDEEAAKKVEDIIQESIEVLSKDALLSYRVGLRVLIAEKLLAVLEADGVLSDTEKPNLDMAYITHKIIEDYDAQR